MGGSSAAATRVAADHIDTLLTWAEPPRDVREKLEIARTAASKKGRALDCGIRMHVIVREAPVIAVPTITMEGDANGAPHLEPAAYAAKFSGRYENRIITGGVGHNLPQEAPRTFANAVIAVDGFA